MVQPYGAGPYYDLLIPHRPERAAFIARRLCRCHRLLDVGAGNGEIAFALAKRGHEVACLEPSRAMFAMLLGRLPALGKAAGRITPICVGVEARLRFRVDAAYCCSVFHLVPGDAGRRRLLRAILRHLPADALLIFDYIGAPAPRSHGPRLRARGRFGGVEYRHWSATRRLRADCHMIDWLVEGRAGRVVVDRYKESFRVRSDPPEYWQALVRRSGGEVMEVYDGYPVRGQRPGLGQNRRQVIVARKSAR